MKTKFGRMACPDCSAPVVVKANERETLSYTCDECDSSAYAKKGAGNYGSWLKRITRVAAPVPAPKADDKKADDKKPVRTSVLDDIA